jgi:hypothetical protein
MSEEIDKHVLRKYEIVSKLGKGVLSQRARHPCSFQKLQSALNEVLLALLRFSCADSSRVVAQAYGIVWKAIDKKTREVVALKKAPPLSHARTPLCSSCAKLAC